ncbi:hypothetical protein FQN49_007931, partial [Arthroderma sp. PD_2]
IYAPETDETPERTTLHGLELLDKIKVAVDKYGRPVATEFLHLPDAKQYPEYYTAVRLPFALDIIEKKLKNHEYTQLTSVESDLRRMVTNAKFYNEKGSQLFSNAERIRKIVVAEMPKVNPAYKDPNYLPFSTPLPDEEEEIAVEEQPAVDETPVKTAKPEAETATKEERTRSSKRTSTRTPTVDREHNVAEATKDEPETSVADRFQAALEAILNEAIRMQDEKYGALLFHPSYALAELTNFHSGEETFAPFVNLPDKQLYKEYYDVIDHPVSLRGILRTVRGTDRRKSTSSKSKPSHFRSWRSFADEVSYLWHNARIFNEDESDIAITAGELEKFFNARIAETRKTVPAPEDKEGGGGPKIRLKLGGAATPEPSVATSKIKLRLPGKPQGDAGPSTPSIHGVRVDAEALKRQQDLVKAGTNGMEAPAASHTNVQATPTRTLRDRTSAARLSMGAASPAAASSNVNGTSVAANVPSLRSRTPLTRRAEAESERESADTTKPSPGLQDTPIPDPTLAPEAPPKSTSTAPAPLSPVDWEKLSQVRNKAYGNGLISHISITSHPSLPLRQPYHISLPCTPILPSQPISVTLPSSMNLINFSPIIASSSQRRPTQHYVTVCDQKNLTPPASTAMRSTDYTKFVYDVRLREGLNKVVVGVSGKGDGETTERVILFVNLLRS